MACSACDKLIDIADLSRPYVVRTCNECGRSIKLRESGPHGIGFMINKGDRVIMPSEFLTISANPLKGTGQFTSHGLKWFAETVFGGDLGKKENRENFPAALDAIIEGNTGFFKNAEYLKGLDWKDPANGEEVLKQINANPKTVEWFGFYAAVLGSIASDAIQQGNAAEAAWAMAIAERYRALAVFKTNFEEVVFMGHSARRLVDLLRVWDSNEANGDEGFWQIKLSENAYAISQLFSMPVTFIKGRAHVGGTSLDGCDTRVLDFMLSGGSASDAILVEIKTPVTPLLGAKYRKNVYPPSKDLGGAIVQVNDYCHTLRENILHHKNTGVSLNTFNPRRVVIIGNHAQQLTDKRKKASFELFRTSLASVDVVTFDEFFKKIEHLAKLFNLERSSTPQSS